MIRHSICPGLSNTRPTKQNLPIWIQQSAVDFSIVKTVMAIRNGDLAETKTFEFKLDLTSEDMFSDRLS